jgi:hypothetical protein
VVDYSRSDLGPQLLSSLEILEEHIHTPSLLSSRVTVTADAVGGTLGVFSADLLAAGAVTEDFDLHFLNVISFSATDSFELVFYQGASDTECGRCRVTRSAQLDSLSGRPILTGNAPHGRIPAGSRIRAKVASDAGGGNIVIEVEYHPY